MGKRMLSQHAPLQSSQAVIFGASFFDAGRDAAHVFEGCLGGVLHGLERIPQDAQLDDEDVDTVMERLDLGGLISGLDVIREDL
jgi:hypothetical protein